MTTPQETYGSKLPLTTSLNLADTLFAIKDLATVPVTEIITLGNVQNSMTRFPILAPGSDTANQIAPSGDWKGLVLKGAGAETKPTLEIQRADGTTVLQVIQDQVRLTPQGKQLYLAPDTGNAPWRVFTSNVTAPNTDDQVLYITNNALYTKAGGWQARDVDGIGVIRFGMESHWSAGGGPNPLAEWNLDIGPKGTGVPTFSHRALYWTYDWSTGDASWRFYTQNAGTFTVYPNNANNPSFIIDSGGNVGIGTSSQGANSVAVVGKSVGIGFTSPVAPLHVTGANGQAIRIEGGGDGRLTVVASGQQNMWEIDNNGGTLRFFREDYSALGAGANGAVRMTLTDAGILSLTAGGKLGIGFTSPVAPLHVTGANSQSIRVEGGGDGRFTIVASNQANMWNLDNSGGTLRFIRDDYNAAGAGANGAVRMSLTDAGNLAIVGAVGFNGAAALAKPNVTGSRGGNAALASLLTSLANYGLITDGTSA